MQIGFISGYLCDQREILYGLEAIWLIKFSNKKNSRRFKMIYADLVLSAVICVISGKYYMVSKLFGFKFSNKKNSRRFKMIYADLVLSAVICVISGKYYMVSKLFG